MQDLLFEFSLDGNGVNWKYGPLIRAWQEGREIIVDEFNKSKAGTDTALQLVLQVLISELAEHTVSLGGQSFTFRARDRKPGFFATFTGNYTDDGAATHELAGSVYSRLQPVFLREPSQEDWAHRICQALCGVPIPTLYSMQEAFFNRKPDSMRDLLIGLRALGLTEAERNAIPNHQIVLLKQWRRTLSTANKLAGFYHGFADMLNPRNRNAPPQLRMELDEMFQRRVAVDFRMALKHIDEALEVDPPVTSLSDEFELVANWTTAPIKTADLFHESPTRFLGTRLERCILDEIDESTIPFGKTHIQAALTVLAGQAGIGSNTLNEGTPNKKFQSVGQLLNIDTGDHPNATPEGKALYEVMIEYLHACHPNIVPEVTQSISMLEFSGAMTYFFGGVNDERTQSPDHLLVFNPFSLNPEQKTAPLIPADIYDDLAPPSTGGIGGILSQKRPKPDAEKLVNLQAFLLALAMPKVGIHNLDAIWKDARRIPASRAEDVDTQHILRATHADNAGLAATIALLRTGKKDAPSSQPVVILRTKVDKPIFVIGFTEIPQALKNLLTKQNIFYLHYTETSGKQIISDMTDDIYEEVPGGKIWEHDIAAAIVKRLDPSKLDQVPSTYDRGKVKYKINDAIAAVPALLQRAVHVHLR